MTEETHIAIWVVVASTVLVSMGYGVYKMVRRRGGQFRKRGGEVGRRGLHPFLLVLSRVEHACRSAITSPRTKRWLIRSGVAAVILTALFFSIAFLPGSVESSYYGGQSCGCAGESAACFRDGHVMVYWEHHEPANLVGTYRKEADGKILFLWQYPGEVSPKPYARVYPRVFVCRMEYLHGGDSHWMWKRPPIGWIRRAVREHPLRRARRTSDTEITVETLEPGFQLIESEAYQQPMPNKPAHPTADEP